MVDILSSPASGNVLHPPLSEIVKIFDSERVMWYLHGLNIPSEKKHLLYPSFNCSIGSSVDLSSLLVLIYCMLSLVVNNEINAPSMKYPMMDSLRKKYCIEVSRLSKVKNDRVE